MQIFIYVNFNVFLEQSAACRLLFSFLTHAAHDKARGPTRQFRYGKRARSKSYELFIFRITAPVIRYALFSYCFGNYLSSFIIAACRANPMRHHRFVALRAGYITRNS